MKLKEYLSNLSSDELTSKLIYIDRSIMDLHNHGYFVVCDMNDIEIINDEITLASFKGKIDYINSGYNINGDKFDILELCAIGICAYNHFPEFHSSIPFIRYLRENIDKYVDNDLIPDVMKEYYIDVLVRGIYEYANIYYLKNNVEKQEEGRERAWRKTKSTAVGRALTNFQEKETAYVDILLVPALITLIYIVTLMTYFFFWQ